MKKLITSTALIVSGFVAAPAIAGGLNQPVMEQSPTLAPAPVMTMPRAPQPAGWGGLYLGGQIGALEADTSIVLSDFLTPNELEQLDLGTDTVEAELDGTFYGLHIGYMYDIGSFVLGAEADYDQVDFDEISATLGTMSVAESVDEDATIARLKLRAGYNAGRFLPYATAGVARLHSEDENTDGTFFGGGVAFKATDNILIGGEVLQHQFNDAFETDLDIEATTLSLRGSYRF